MQSAEGMLSMCSPMQCLGRIPLYSTLAFVACGLSSLSGCANTSGNDSKRKRDAAALECAEVRATSCDGGVPSYAEVQPIFESRCADCHSGVPRGPWPLMTYDQVAGWSSEVRSQVETCRMPPNDGGVMLTESERTLMVDWLRCGLPR